MYKIPSEDLFEDLSEWSFQSEDSPYLACNERNAFFTSAHMTDKHFGREKICVKP